MRDNATNSAKCAREEEVVEGGLGPGGGGGYVGWIQRQYWLTHW